MNYKPAYNVYRPAEHGLCSGIDDVMCIRVRWGMDFLNSGQNYQDLINKINAPKGDFCIL